MGAAAKPITPSFLSNKKGTLIHVNSPFIALLSSRLSPNSSALGRALRLLRPAFSSSVRGLCRASSMGLQHERGRGPAESLSFAASRPELGTGSGTSEFSSASPSQGGHRPGCSLLDSVRGAQPGATHAAAMNGLVYRAAVFGRGFVQGPGRWPGRGRDRPLSSVVVDEQGDEETRAFGAPCASDRAENVLGAASRPGRREKVK